MAYAGRHKKGCELILIRVELRASREVREHKSSFALRAAYFSNFRIVVFVSVLIVVCCSVLINKPESRGGNSGRKGLKKRVAVSTGKDWPSKAARM